uniref:Uncharacterized protein n=1 Tax=Clastoptera arizonana TaxID=38151 RepID=A0A1B6C6L4_9HEMI
MICGKMEMEVKQRTQRNRRRERAQRMHAQKRENKTKNGIDSAEDDSPTREKPQRPPPPSRRKKNNKEPQFEEDVIDGFAILSFRSYEELENTIRLCGKTAAVTLGWDDVIKSEPHINHTPTKQPHVINNHDKVPTTHDPGTSDDSGRERLTTTNTTTTTNNTALRDRESSHDRLSDASSRCSSGRGYICDSEGDDDKVSDAGSVLFAPTTRKHELPGHHTPVSSPGPLPTPTVTVVPESVLSKPQQHPQPPSTVSLTQFSVTNGPLVGHSGHSNHPRLPSPTLPVVTSSVASQPPRPSIGVNSSYSSTQFVQSPVPNSVYISSHSHPATTSFMPPQHTPNSAYVSHPPPQSHCTTVLSDSSPIVVAAPSSYVPTAVPALSNYPPLYAPYNNTPYLSPIPSSRMNRSPLPAISTKCLDRSGIVTTTATAIITTTTTTSHRDIVSTPLVGRSHSPRGHSPTRERDSYSSNVSTLSRGSVTPVSLPAPPSNISPYNAPAPASVVQPPSTSSSLQYNKAPVWVGGTNANQIPPANSVVRHQLPHSHPHAFPTPIFAPPVASASSTAAPVPPPAPPPTNPIPFSAESLFQSNQADLLRRELDTRFLASQDRSLVPPPYLRTEMHHHQHQHTHVHQHAAPMLPPPPPTLFTPPIFKDIPKLGGVDSPFYRQNLGLSSYPGFSPGLLHPGLGSTPFAPPNHLPTFTPKKTGKWNAMHVRIAWEIYHHQQKQAAEVKVGVSLGTSNKGDLLRPPTHLFPGPPRTHDLSSFTAPHRTPHASFDNPSAHQTGPPFTNLGNSMFGRYPQTAPFPSLATFPHGTIHDPWSRLQSRTANFPAGIGPPWSLKPDPGLNEADRERERERERDKERERSRERERCRREEKQRRILAAQQQVNKVRDRSPIRENATVVSKEEEVVLLGRPPPHYLSRHPTSRALPAHFAPNPWDHPYRYEHLRFNPIMAAAFRDEEDQRAKLFGTYPPPPPHMRGKAPSPHRPVVPSHQHPIPHDLHKKEESSQSR